MRISDHQPYLFGHQGYWSKIASSDVHVIMADVLYRKEDKLAHGVTSRGQQFQAQLRLADSGVRIADLRLVQTRKLRCSIEQHLMSKHHRYRHRLEPFIDKLTDDVPYMDMMLEAFHIVIGFTGIKTWPVVSFETPSGSTTFARNLNRLTVVHGFTAADEYVCGPHVTDYKKEDEKCPIPMLKHEMPWDQRSPQCFLETIVTEQSPRIFLPKLSELPS